MDKDSLLWAFYEISMSIGNTLELQKMLNESLRVMLSKLNCSSAAIYQNSHGKSKLIHAKPKVLIKNKDYVTAVQELEEKFYNSHDPVLIEKFDDRYYYLFELKNYGYLVLTKSDHSFDDLALNSLQQINLKLVNAIQACIDNAKLRESKARLLEAQSIAHRGSWTMYYPSMHHNWDDEIYRIFGEEPQSFIPTYRYLLKHLTKKSQKEIRRAIHQVLVGRRKYYEGIVEIIK